ncbi:hypothetical protein [Kosakonia sacchari]|uniref:hypothetical protein n=1 Tax=Kosakonia sacchari TaxID=1158459 RepID=UPI000BE5A51A|nr:hypothetical protein [Kosakonia sacchari]PDO89828.1 hypothetical protein BK797_02250 [Kosakonia sacchari]
MNTNALDFVLKTPIETTADLAPLLERLKGVPDHGQSKRKTMLTDNKVSAQVNAGSLISFTERLDGQNKQDVQNSTLFAQLAADKHCNRYTAPMDWYRFYVNVLGQIGWNQPAFAFDTYTSGASTVKLDEAVLGIIAQIATVGEVALVAAAMKALSSLSDTSKQMLIWDAKSNSENTGNIQIFPADLLPNGDVVMMLDGMQFDAKRSEGRFLWVTWQSTSIKIQRAANKFVLNEGVYKGVRQAVIDKLGDRAIDMIANIEI